MEILLVFLVPFVAVTGVFILILGLVFFVKNGEYKQSEYYKITQIPMMQVYFDKGRLGEYYTYRYLEKLEGEKRYLFNCYLPKENGTTTEIDVILIHETGVYVFESKNYSGWIFGHEEQRNWTQTLPKGRGRSQKTQFLNPIIQNKVHLKWLKKFLADYNEIPFYSYIIFSDRCELKNITLTSDEHRVINRYDILSAVEKNSNQVGRRLDDKMIKRIYYKLYPLTQFDEAKKLVHIQNIEENHLGKGQQGLNLESVEKTFALETEKKEKEENLLLDQEAVIEELCPRCNSKLVLRVSKKGENIGKKFYGCSAFPKCRFIKELDDYQEGRSEMKS